MFTLTNSTRTLAKSRNFVHTQTTGLIDQAISAEHFTDKLERNAQIAYKKVSDKVMDGQWPLSIGELQKSHETLCGELQTGGGQMNFGEALRYQASCGELINSIKSANTSRDRITALAEHTARCEGMQIFLDHNSTVHRLALEAHMDMFLGKAQRPPIDQDAYFAAVEKAQNGNSKPLVKLIENNQEQGAKVLSWTERMSLDYKQNLGPDYAVSHKPDSGLGY